MLNFEEEIITEKGVLKISVIGVGNTGNQVAALAKERGIESVIAVNSSQKDLETVKDKIHTLLIGDTKGAGKDRNQAKEFIKKSIGTIIEQKHLDSVCDGKDVVFIVTSTGGGTGSGMGPILHAVLSATYPKTHFILAGVSPTISESLAAQQNSLEWLQEMKKTNPTYMIYDNGNYSDQGTDMFRLVNSDIVEDMLVIRGDYQLDTPLTSIDERDSMKLYTTKGRLVIGRIKDVSEKDIESKSIEDRIISQIKNSAHAEVQYDNVLRRQGLIVNLSNKMYKTIDQNLSTIRGVFGEPIESFEHLAIDDRNQDTTVSMVLSGLSFPDDRIAKTLKRIKEVQDSLGKEKASILDEIDLTDVSGLRKEDSEPASPSDIKDILAMFD